LKVTTGIFLFCFLLLPISFGFSTEIYKWTDKNGKIIFSDSPPPPGVDGEIKKFEEPQAPQSKEKPKPKAVVPQARPDASPPPATGTAIQRPQVDPALKEKPKAPADSPQPITASREKRPYESINVIMYMTVW
jgi:hypothetical protein